jgi:anti-anti-sigma factor
MKVKLDTKQKFRVITLQEPSLSANMTDELKEMLLLSRNKNIRNIILNLKDVKEMDRAVGATLVNIQQMFYEENASFVICEVQKTVEIFLDEIELLELMNITPTESEAWDIIQMEEIERELYNEE